jgi:multidrug efflux pump subunit AcrA (membrane-fusion protein)
MTVRANRTPSTFVRFGRNLRFLFAGWLGSRTAENTDAAAMATHGGGAANPLLSGCGDGDQKAKAASPPPAVTVVAVVEHDIRPSLTFSGRVQARDKVDLRARVEGFLEKRLFNEGQDVKKGDLLFVIEQAPYKASIAEIKATIQKAQAVLTLADLEVARASQLVAREVGTQKRLDETTAQQGNARGELARQKAALEKAELDLSYTDIRAPLAGRIGRSQFSSAISWDPQAERWRPSSVRIRSM